MKYLILIYHNPESRQVWDSFSEEERAEGLGAYAALNRELAESGELVATEALADPEMTKVVTVRNGQVAATDGPFAEVKEQLAGFFLVDCESIERAIEIGSRIPDAEVATIEVRPVMTYAGLEA